jgi:hypothetical protein
MMKISRKTFALILNAIYLKFFNKKYTLKLSINCGNFCASLLLLYVQNHVTIFFTLIGCTLRQGKVLQLSKKAKVACRCHIA